MSAIDQRGCAMRTRRSHCRPDSPHRPLSSDVGVAFVAGQHTRQPGRRHMGAARCVGTGIKGLQPFTIKRDQLLFS